MPTTAEDAVRTYLRAMRDPASVRDEQMIASLRQKLEQADDPLERLRLRSELDRAETVDLSALEEAFTTHAKAWAEKQQISPEAFTAEGVEPRVLRAAGFPAARGTRGRTRRSTKGGSARVTRDDVRKLIPRREFTIGELAERSGASLGTIRTVIKDLLASGELEALGAQENHAGPGRAPTIYRRRA